MLSRFSKNWVLFLFFSALLPVSSGAQSFNSSISGTVTDPSGAVVPNATLTLTAVDTGKVSTVKTGPDGLYSFPNLQAGNYELKVSAAGFRDFVQKGISILVNQVARQDIKLELGAETQTIEVLADVSPLNFETPELKQSITPEAIRELPLIVGGAVRSSAQFVTLMPGVNTGAGQSGFDSRINGGLWSGDEAVIDGVTLSQGINGNTGMISAWADYPWSPEAISEVSVLTANYEPQYGSTTSAVVTAETKAGTKDWHGTLYEFHRNTALNARQFGIPNRPKDIENDYGGTISGPVKIPWVFSSPQKNSYFFLNYEGFKIRGGASTPTLSIPSLKERQGDFTDWVDSNGKLIPIFDPATTRPNPAFNPNLPAGPNNLQFLRDQFMGCDGRTPNVICPDRIQNSLAKQFFQFLPTPTFSGPLNNYVVPVPISATVFADSLLVDVRVDQYWRDKDHFYVTVHHRGSKPSQVSQLPAQLASEEPYEVNYSFVDRLNWTHTFSPTLLNHFAFGYLDTVIGVTSFNKPYASTLPQIPGAESHEFAPIINFSDFERFGDNLEDHGTRPVYVANDLLTWVRGRHTFKFGGEMRRMGTNETIISNGSGNLNFTRLGTGLNEINSGNSIASFLVEQVESASLGIQTVPDVHARLRAYDFHFGDTLKVSPKLSLNFGIRWDLFKPSLEKFDNLSFFDLLGPNPGAGNRPGRLAFAGTKWGAASFGRRYPELLWKKAFSPRIGFAYSLTPKTVIRTGYGIFYSNPIYPGWGGGMGQDGFNATIPFSSSNSGYTPAFILSQGFPAIPSSQRPPFIDSSFDNGKDIMYRPFDANRLPYAQQWNLTVEHQFTNDIFISAAYVANKGTRLPSRTAPLNALDPKYLSMGTKLNDEFQPTDTSVNGVPLPYAGWVEQMRCAPTVAQALLPYPQYCSSLQGTNENAGNSTYHSFQLKVEKRFSQGFYMLGSYTLSKLLTSSDGVQIDAATWSGSHGVISPFERGRNKGLGINDTPQAFALSLIYQLPFGSGKRYSSSSGILNQVVGGWQLSTVFRATSGIPFFFRSGNCNVPGQFRAGCIPAIGSGANPFAQDKGGFDPNKPLFNPSAFEPAESFNFYFGQGPRISNLRAFGYHNQDIGLFKNTRISEKLNLQIRAELFNAWNWHTFTNPGGDGGFNSGVIDIDVSSPSFGLWNGLVSVPRNIQFGIKLLF